MSGRRLTNTILSMLALLAAAALTRPASAAEPLRNPQVVFSSAAVQAWLDSWQAGRQALADQLDIQAFHDEGLLEPVIGLLEPATVEFGIYAADRPGEPYRVPLFRPASGLEIGECKLLIRYRQGVVVAVYFDSNGSYLGDSVLPWPVGADRFGLYVSGPEGTWYSQDALNSGAAHFLAYENQPGTAPEHLLFVETGPGGAAHPGTFTGIVGYHYSYFCEPFPNSCGPVAARPSTWGQLKTMYR